MCVKYLFFNQIARFKKAGAEVIRARSNGTTRPYWTTRLNDPVVFCVGASVAVTVSG
jgi:hypothetical protein